MPRASLLGGMQSPKMVSVVPTPIAGLSDGSAIVGTIPPLSERRISFGLFADMFSPWYPPWTTLLAARQPDVSSEFICVAYVPVLSQNIEFAISASDELWAFRHPPHSAVFPAKVQFIARTFAPFAEIAAIPSARFLVKVQFTNSASEYEI